jgi:hypothetical protein
MVKKKAELRRRTFKEQEVKWKESKARRLLIKTTSDKREVPAMF